MKIQEYQSETKKLARESTVLLEEVRARLVKGGSLSLLEQRGVLHSVQLLIENAIGKAKRWIKLLNQPVPVSGYDAFELLVSNKIIQGKDLDLWKKVIGLRNAIVHEYQNLDWGAVETIIKEDRMMFVVDFLIREFDN